MGVRDRLLEPAVGAGTIASSARLDLIEVQTLRGDWVKVFPSSGVTLKKTGVFGCRSKRFDCTIELYRVAGALNERQGTARS